MKEEKSPNSGKICDFLSGGRYKLSRIFGILIIALEVLCLLWAGSLFLQEKRSYSFPFQKLVPGNAIELEDFMGESGFYIDNGMDYSGSFISSPGFTIPRGTWQITIHYRTEGSGQFYNVTARDATYRIITGRQKEGLDPSKNSTTFTMWLDRDTEDFQIELGYEGNGYLFVNSILIQETNAWKRIRFFEILLLCILIDIVYIVISKGVFKNCPVGKRKIYISLLLIIAFASSPIFSYFLYNGHDLTFHLLRIQGLKEGLLSGQFPVKLQPNWLNGYGYGVSVFYGDLFLYVPAFFTLIGFQIQTAYKVYIILVNTATCLIAYYCFRKIFADNKSGLLASLLYTLAPYRLTNLYIRAAVGEYTAMVFLPLIFYGFFCIYKEEKSGKGCVFTVIGLTGLLQTHILSCEMTGLLILVFCMILWKKTFQPKRFLVLAKTVMYTIIANLWFLVPFLDYMQGSYKVTDSMEDKIQTSGAFISQMVSFFPSAFGEGYSVSERIGDVENMPFAIGAAFLFGLIMFVFYCMDNHVQAAWEKKLGKLCMAVGVMLLFMATIWFPWDRLQEVNGVLKFFIQKLQFSWRFLGVATLMFTVVCVCLVRLLYDKNRDKAKATGLFLGIVAIFSGGWLLSSLVNENNVIYVPDESKLDTFQVVSGEYIPSGTNIGEMGNNELIPSENIVVTYYNKAYNKVWIHCENNSQERGEIEVPLLYYKGYAACDDTSGEKLEVGPGTNNRVKIVLQPGYKGSIELKFVEPIYWRIAEIISLVFIAGTAVCYIGKIRRK